MYRFYGQDDIHVDVYDIPGLECRPGRHVLVIGHSSYS